MAQADLLGRFEFVEMLEMIVSNKVDQRAGCSLAIDGKWGCGKSFILKMLEKKLKGCGYFVVHYNCWQNDYYEEPLEAILSVLVDALNGLKSSETIQEGKKKKTLEIALNLFKSISFMVAKNKFGVDFKEIGVELDQLKKDVGEALSKDKAELLTKDFDSNQLLKKSIEIIYQLLLEIKLEFRGVVLVVDELDRCIPEYAIKVLERLHHICYDTENDLFQFIQIAAINREELCDGISKMYGRGYMTSNAIVTSGPGTYSSKNYFDKKGSFSFGNYYLQKFIQMIIPVPPGKSSQTALPILNGLEKYFDVQNELQMQLLRDLFEMAFSEVSIRIREQLVALTDVAHQITLEMGHANGIDRIKPSLNVLCVELLDCFCRAIMMSSLPEVKMEYERAQNVIGYPTYNVRDAGMCSLKINCKAQFVNSSDSFEKDVFETFKTEYRLFVEKENKLLPEMGFKLPKVLEELDMGNQKEKKYIFDMDNPKAEVLWYYLSKDDKLEAANGLTPSEFDEKFVKAFRRTLDVIAPV